MRKIPMLVLAALGLAACSSDESSDDSGDAEPAITASSDTTRDTDAGGPSEMAESLSRLVDAISRLAASSSPNTDDFAREAEDFIGDPDGDVAAQVGVTFEDVSCTSPPTADLGAEFTCEAIGSDGVRWSFTAEVDGPQSFQITAGAPVD